MGLVAWIASHVVSTAFWLWIVKWGGAERIEGSFIGALLTGIRPTWDSEGIKLMGWLMLIAGAIWFVIGIAVPDVRFN